MCRRQIHHPEGAGCMCRSPYGFWPHTLHLRHTCHPDTRGHILALPGCKLLCPRSPHLSYSLPPDSGRMDFPAVPVCTHILGCGSQPGSQHSDHIELWGMGQHTLEICMLCQQDNQGFSRIHLQNCQFEYVMIMKMIEISLHWKQMSCGLPAHPVGHVHTARCRIASHLASLPQGS